jgi:uncharacterized YigZ family protein
MTEGYPVPAERHRSELRVRRSRFIATLAPAKDEEDARAVIHAVRQEFPDATHHCWAYVAGPPGDTARVGLSDDGEPRGTAGRPILTALLHSGVGDVVAVVTRYFGGVKLGKGGLGRAYAGAVTEALESLPTTPRLQRVLRGVEVDYPQVDPLLRLLDEVGAERLEEVYGRRVRMRVLVPERALDRLERGVAALSGGAGRVDALPETGR